MSVEKQQISSSYMITFHLFTYSNLLARIPGHGYSKSGHQTLHKPGAIKTQRADSAPQVWHAEEFTRFNQ